MTAGDNGAGGRTPRPPKPEKVFEGVIPIFLRALFGRSPTPIAPAPENRSQLVRAWRPISISFAAGLALFSLAAGFVAASLPAPDSQKSIGWGFFGVVELYFIAAATAGIVVGFLFAVPRVLTSAGVTVVTAGATTGDADATETATEKAQQALLGSNSNLERISDWLTSAIVALSLTNIDKVSGWLADLGRRAGEGMCAAETAVCPGIANVTAQTTVIFATAWGLLLGYLYTRVFVSVMFRDAEQEIRQSARIEAIFRDTNLERMVLDTISRTQPGDEGAPTLAQDDRTKLETLAKRDLKDEQDAKRAVQVAEARLVLARPVDAAAAAERAQRLAPEDRTIAARVATVKSQVTQQAIFDALFEPPPGGFSKAIELSDGLLKEGLPVSPAFWVNRACAFGQKYGWLLAQTPHDEAALAQTRQDAISAIRRTLEIAPDRKHRLRELWEPTYNPGSDKDLASLYRDEEIAGLLT